MHYYHLTLMFALHKHNSFRSNQYTYKSMFCWFLIAKHQQHHHYHHHIPYMAIKCFAALLFLLLHMHAYNEPTKLPENIEPH